MRLPVIYIVVLVLPLVLSGCQGAIPSRQAVVSGASMAPLLLGEHFKVVCDDCRYAFECDATRMPDNDMAVCPNCGFSEIRLAELKPRSASSAKIVPLDSTATQKIDRGDIVAFELTDEPLKTIGVKRVIGLPSEKIVLRNGDIFVNGKLFSKPVEMQRSMRIPVYDSSYVPKTERLPPRQIAEPADILWDDYVPAFFAYMEEPGQFEAQAMPALDWITYRQWRCCRHNDDRTKEFPVEDYYAYNQANSRNLNPTDELFFRMEFDCKEDAIVLFALPHSGLRFKASMNVGSRTATFFNPMGAQDSYHFDHRIGSAPAEIEISTIDHTFVMLIDGYEVIKQRIFFPGRVNDISTTPFGIASTKDTFELKRLQVWRDVYYLNEGEFYADGNFDKALVPGEDQYILLGDNSPMSADSRNWDQPAVAGNRILGKVVLQ